jgi:hypothetical protein
MNLDRDLGANPKSLDEGSWAFVFERSGNVESLIFRRSRELDAVNVPPPLPEAYERVHCASRASGVIFRYDEGERRYITLARPKG